LEILIAVFILAIVLSTIYAAYLGTFRIIQQSETDREIYGMARNTMQRLMKDLSSIAAYGGKFKFVSRTARIGGANFADLTFVANSHLAFAEEEPLTGLAEITYYVDEDPSGEGYRLMRKDILTTGKDIEGEGRGGFILCSKLHALRYIFFDNNDQEFDFWDSSADAAGQKNKVPSMVAIQLQLVNDRDNDQPFMFMTRVLLPLSFTVQATTP